MNNDPPKTPEEQPHRDRSKAPKRAPDHDSSFLPPDKTAQSDVTQTNLARTHREDGSSPSAKVARQFPKIEGYQITGVIGQGGMGIVYRATQTKLHRTVALKVLPAVVGTASPAAVARFRREATSAARLHHTNIVPIYDYGESYDGYYYAMELISGRPLNELIHRFPKLQIASASTPRFAEIIRASLSDVPLADWGDSSSGDIARDSSGSLTTSSSGRGRPYYQQAALWMANAADALHYAHSVGIIHRDIKPANLILSADNRIMIADFGLAKSTDEQSITMTGSLMGTLRYISPEQAMAKRVRVDHRTDVYSLGATMYELLCFEPAYPGTDEKEILGAIISRDPIPPRKIAHHVPHELETICLKCLEKNPDSRYATARSLAEDIQRYLHDMPIVAKRPGPLGRVIKFVKRRKAQVMAVTAIVLVVALVPLLYRARGRARADRIKALIENAQNLVASDQDWDNAEKAVQKALAMNPNHVRAMLTHVWIKLEQFKAMSELHTVANPESLLAYCNRVLKNEPDNSLALNYQSVLLKELKHYDEAIESVRRIVVLDPEYFPACSNLGAYYALAGKVEAAEKSLKKAVELAKQSKESKSKKYEPQAYANTLRNLAALELYRNQPQAAEHVSRAIQANPTDVPSRILQVRIRLQLEGYLDAEEALEEANYADRLTNGKNPKAKRMRALAYLRNGKLDQAIEQAKLALERNDSPAINHLIIAVAEAKRGNPIGAQDRLKAAGKTWPGELKGADFVVTYDHGFLWFDTKQELNLLRAEAEKQRHVRPQKS